jgi:hypothetical protein
MLHRLYLSLFWLLVTFGVLVTGGAAIVQAHDHVVIGEDRECFIASKKAEATVQDDPGDWVDEQGRPRRTWASYPTAV